MHSSTTYSKDNPFLAKLIERRSLNSSTGTKDTKHFVIDITGSHLQYTSGDSIGIYASNNPDIVQSILKALRIDPQTLVKIPKTEEIVTIEYALIHKYSLNQPTGKFLEFLKNHVTNEAEKKLLEHLLAPENTEELKNYLAQREYIDLAEEFRSASLQPQEYIDQLRRLMPRLYSIASSSLLHPNHIHLTVSVISYQTNGRIREGLATSFLDKRIPLNTPCVPIFITESHFRLPEDPQADIIMVGPGTGVAPFRAFMQERIATKALGKNWLFFGDQYRASDYLYEEEWEAWHQQGLLHRLDLAFSRDQTNKVYVQHKMEEKGAILWQWIESGAYFYVCGDAKQMAKDVDASLHAIIQNHGKMTEEQAKEFVKLMKKNKRYQKDVY